MVWPHLMPLICIEVSSGFGSWSWAIHSVRSVSGRSILKKILFESNPCSVRLSVVISLLEMQEGLSHFLFVLHIVVEGKA